MEIMNSNIAIHFRSRAYIRNICRVLPKRGKLLHYNVMQTVLEKKQLILLAPIKHTYNIQRPITIHTEE